jgi:DNA replication and repair protein RecF
LKSIKKDSVNYINSIRMKSFRSHLDISINPGKGSVLILGSNGAGKTSILEAISIFSYGKGIRNAKFYEMANKDKDNFMVDLTLQTTKDLSLEYKTFYDKNNKLRKTYINDKEISAINSRKNIPMLWIAPYTEKIFSGAAGPRRVFLDRIVSTFDDEHSNRISGYEKNLKQRTKILKEKPQDIVWLETIEKQLSRLSVAISSSRLEVIIRLAKYLKKPINKFPEAKIFFKNSIEEKLVSTPALDLEESLSKQYRESREIDMILGGSRVGCHKSDLEVINLQKNLPALMCSSGEQKSLLISIIISTAIAFKEYTKKSPIILLDEVFTHLDLEKKESLLDELTNLESQVWITATEKERFLKNRSSFCYHYLTKSGLENV